MEKQTHNVKEPGKAKGLMHMIEYAQEPHVVTESKYKPKGKHLSRTTGILHTSS